MILKIKGETQLALKVTGHIDFVIHIDFGMTIWILPNFASHIKQISANYLTYFPLEIIRKP